MMIAKVHQIVIQNKVLFVVIFQENVQIVVQMIPNAVFFHVEQ